MPAVVADPAVRRSEPIAVLSRLAEQPRLSLWLFLVRDLRADPLAEQSHLAHELIVGLAGFRHVEQRGEDRVPNLQRVHLARVHEHQTAFSRSRVDLPRESVTLTVVLRAEPRLHRDPKNF